MVWCLVRYAFSFSVMNNENLQSFNIFLDGGRWGRDVKFNLNHSCWSSINISIYLFIICPWIFFFSLRKPNQTPAQSESASSVKFTDKWNRFVVHSVTYDGLVLLCSTGAVFIDCAHIRVWTCLYVAFFNFLKFVTTFRYLQPHLIYMIKKSYLGTANEGHAKNAKNV